MTAASPNKYQMTLSLNVLNHLGIGLYSNVPAVLSETIANSWDADATKVIVDIDVEGSRITIQDDGHGMSVSDANQRYLHVGYERRKAGQARTPKFKRPVMGRKGIGKLSLFSIARTVEVHSVKDGLRHGFKMDLEEIEEAISGEEGIYQPSSVDPRSVDIDSGTKIILTDMKRRLHQSPAALRRRLARRFSVIGSETNFYIVLNDSPISVEDRGYHDKLQYIWTFGEAGRQSAKAARSLEDEHPLTSKLYVGEVEYQMDGWIGTAEKSGQLKESETGESINKIVVMVRGKLAQEDILDEFSEGGIYSKYIIGEVHANFLDLDEEEDIATTSRQQMIEDDPRYQALKAKILTDLKTIQSEWTNLRNQAGEKKALDIPEIKQWFASLTPDHRSAARKLFGRINQLPIDDESEMRRLYVSGILAFENLKFRGVLNRLEHISPESILDLGKVFAQLDDLEASAYYQIASDRLAVIRALQGLIDEDAKERVIQEYLFDHLWLLDPSWERAAKTASMEERVEKAFIEVDSTLTEEQRMSRLDIKYTTTGNKHVVIELKRAGRTIAPIELVQQIDKYHKAVTSILTRSGRGNEPLEFVCVIGKEPPGWYDGQPGRTNVYADMMNPLNARIVLYDELIENAEQAYQDFIDSSKEAGRVYKLITSILPEDYHVMSPAPS